MITVSLTEDEARIVQKVLKKTAKDHDRYLDIKNQFYAQQLFTTRKKINKSLDAFRKNRKDHQ